MTGGPSQVDTFDYKPALQKRDGEKLAGADPKTGFFTTSGKCLASPFKWAQHGKSGTWVSDVFPSVARHADDLALVHSCHSVANNHAPASMELAAGVTRPGYPTMGAWLSYGLGSETDELPAFVVMSDPLDRGLPKGHALNWGAGFLPGVFQGTHLRPKGEPIDNLKRPSDVAPDAQRRQLDLLARLNGHHLDRSLRHRADRRHGEKPHHRRERRDALAPAR